MIEIHLKDSRVLKIDAPGEEITFNEADYFIIKRKHDGHDIAIAHVPRENLAFCIVEDHVTVEGTAQAVPEEEEPDGGQSAD